MAGLMFGLFSFDPATRTWTDLLTLAGYTLNAPSYTWTRNSAPLDFVNFPPTHRYFHGFTSIGGELFVHGGYGFDGNESDLMHASQHLGLTLICCMIARAGKI
jgi:hypothetical protein